jgi:hypothetical protein
MATALAVSSVGYAIAKRLGRPLLAPWSLWPTRADIDRPLVTGAVLFGVDWGLTALPGAGPGEPRDILARHHRLRRRHGGRHGGI